MASSENSALAHICASSAKSERPQRGAPLNETPQRAQDAFRWRVAPGDAARNNLAKADSKGVERGVPRERYHCLRGEQGFCVGEEDVEGDTAVGGRGIAVDEAGE
ncbi:hypothetical protein MKEN_00596200 [Mycena kentingensis (nom. inval.)]|nr:hypothetical protein MKEN_00596200 [Mycena kentingensis (nom. inval.)]